MKYSDFFIKKTRNGKDEFIKLTDDAPEIMGKLVREIHFNLFDGALPNDWIYEIVADAFYAYEDCPSLEPEEVEADPYYSQLLEWLNENGTAFAIDFCDQYCEEFSINTPRDKGLNFMRIVAGAQWLAKMRIYEAVRDFTIVNEVSDDT